MIDIVERLSEIRVAANADPKLPPDQYIQGLIRHISKLELEFIELAVDLNWEERMKCL